jgi:hypothetical protein
MSNGFPPVSPRTPAIPFPQDYDPTAAAVLEMMRAAGTPTPNPRFGPVPTAQPASIGVMPPGWRGGPPAVGPSDAILAALRQFPSQALEAIRTLPHVLNPLEQGKAAAEQVTALNKAGHPILGLAAALAGVGAPELGPEVTAATRPILADIEQAARGAVEGSGFKMPQAAIVSASLGHLSPAENAARHAAMSDLLKSWGVEHVEVQGRWKNPAGKWESEKSYLIPNFERAQAAHLGDRFGQHSVITIGGDEPGLHSLETGQTVPYSGIRQAGRREAHTVLPGGAKVSFDFEGAPRQTGTPAPQPRGPASKRLFAEQKAALWPTELSGRYPGEDEPKIPAGAPAVLGASDPKYAYRTSPTYHGTHEAGFEVPTQSSDIGPHTGTREQAQSLLAQKQQLGMGSADEARVLRLYSEVKNPLRITSDLGSWHPVEVAEALAKHPAFKGTPAAQSFKHISQSAQDDLRAIAGMPPTDWSQAQAAERVGWLNEIKTVLQAHGYDAIEYPNSFEGKPSQIINTETGEVRPYRAGTAKDVDMGYPERAFSGFSTIHLDSEKTLSTKASTRGYAIPPEDVPTLATGVAHLGATAKTPQEFAAAVAREHPELGAQMQASPWLANKMFGTVRTYRGLLKNMPTTEETIAAARSPEGQGIQKWYNETDNILKQAGLNDQEREVFHRIGAVSSIQKSPKDELARALKAFAVWKQDGAMANFSQVPGYTKVQRKMLDGIAVDNPWTDITKGEKVSGYKLARSGQVSGLAIDRHIAEYYTGKQNLNAAEKAIVEARLRHDAAMSGMSDREFQAAVWGAQTGYKPGFGQSGATLENWLRYHLASGQHEELVKAFPGFQKLAEEGARMGEHLPPTGGRPGTPF